MTGPTTFADALRSSADWLRMRLGLRPRCGWVQARLGAYVDWDLGECEYRATAVHLSECAVCAAALERTAALLKRVRAESSLERKLQSVSAESFMQTIACRIERFEKEKRVATEVKRRRMWREEWGSLLPAEPVRRLAALSLLVISAAAVAQYGASGFRHASAAWIGSPNEDFPETYEAPVTAAKAQIVETDLDQAPQIQAKPAQSSAVADFVLPPQTPQHDLARHIEAITANTEAQALAPKTEAEWEAWAREQYPHVMAVHDLLTRPEYGIGWNGDPASVPEWAQSIWTDEQTRPSGWRALLCYSGEILKFDYPEEGDRWNVRPNTEGMKRAAAVAGFELRIGTEGDFSLPELAYGETDRNDQENRMSLSLLQNAERTSEPGADPGFESNEPEDNESLMPYAAQLARDKTRCVTVANHIRVSSAFVPGPLGAQLQETSIKLVAQLVGAARDVCSSATFPDEVAHLLAQRRNLAEQSRRSGIPDGNTP